MTTIKDIARESGFSVSTVSRVMAGHPDVHPATAAAVQAVIDRRHFMANRNAQGLKRSATTAILVMVKGRSNMLFASMLEYVQEAVTATGHTVVTQYLDEDGDEVAEAERLVPEVKPRGVLFLGADPAHMATAELIGDECPAVVLTNVVPDGGRAISCVTTDDTAAADAAVTYLIDHGHRRIGVIGGNVASSMMSAHRQAGVLRAMAANGLPFDVSTQYVGTRYSLESGFAAALQLVDAMPGLTAIYAMSDIMALGAVRALFERGLSVPGDVSVIGHDGIVLASYMVPKLVTIRQPQKAMVSRAVEILMRHIAGDSVAVTEFVDVDIVDGESVRAIKAQ